MVVASGRGVASAQYWRSYDCEGEPVEDIQPGAMQSQFQPRQVPPISTSAWSSKGRLGSIRCNRECPRIPRVAGRWR